MHISHLTCAAIFNRSIASQDVSAERCARYEGEDCRDHCPMSGGARLMLCGMLLLLLGCAIMSIGQGTAAGHCITHVSGRRRLILGGMVLVLLGSAVPAIAQGTGSSSVTTPIVVVREDDIRGTWRTPFVGLGNVSGLTYGMQKNIPITWGIIASFASDASTNLTWAELKDYLDATNGEAASHSVTHQAMPSDAAYVSELVNSKAMIQANLPGYSCTTFLQPGEWTGDGNMGSFANLNNTVGQAIQSTYTQSQAYLGSAWLVGNVYYDYGLAPTYGLDYCGAASPIDALNATLNIVAATPGLVFVVTCHGVQEEGGTDNQEVPADVLKAFMDTLASLRDAGKIRLMTMHDAYHAQFPSNLNHISGPGIRALFAGTAESGRSVDAHRRCVHKQYRRSG